MASPRKDKDVESSLNTTSEDVGYDDNTSARIQSVGLCGLLFNFIFMILFIFFPILMGFYTLDPQKHAIIIFWGKLVSVKKTPGLHWYWPLGRTVRMVPTSTQTLDIKKRTVVDKNGNPICVAGIVTFKLVNTVRAALDVNDYECFIEKQALTVLKRVCSMYPYEAKDGKSLQSESEEVSQRMVKLLQIKANVAGAKILSFELADLQYAPEIAAGMLVRQQAQALITARKTIVEGAVSIVTHAMEELEEKGIKLSQPETERLISNLLAVICSDTHAQPVFSVTESANADSKEDGSREDWQKQMMTTLAKIALNTTPRQ